MNISLTSNEKILLENIFSKNISLNKKYGNKISENKIDLNNNEIEDICNIINAEFIGFGLLDNFEPNLYGLALESLLDTINRPRVQSVV